MYLTQSSFMGKTGPVTKGPETQPYPNQWMEERNLRTLHRKSKSLFPGADGDVKVQVANQKYVKVSDNSR